MADGKASRTRAVLSAHLAALRPRQWVKNVLVFTVPLAAGALLDVNVLADSSLAFVAFCLASSSIYLLNDARDVVADRQHPVKRHRPIARGDVAIGTAMAASVVLGVLALGLAWYTAPQLAAVIGIYLALQVAYSLGLKHQPVLDLALVASGFILRAVAGGAAAGLPVSQWFILTAAFGALFMVAGKRYSELRHAPGIEAARTRRALAGYTQGYLRFVWTLAATITLSAYALWALELQQSQTSPMLLQLSIVPFVLSVLRYAMVVEHAEAGEPDVVILSDRVLQLLGAVWLLLFALGS